MSDKPINIFFSYAHEDESLRDEMAKHLANLKRQRVITDWYDRQIPPGNEWDDEIKTHLNTADIILLLISSDFMASDYCTSVEMEGAVERHNRKEACVIPVILRPCDWDGAPFSKLQALPKDAKPVTRWDDLDEAFLNVVKGIKAAITKIKRKPAPVTSPPPSPEMKFPRIWNVPHLRNPNFTGREEELKALRNSLQAGKTAALVQASAIHGLGGVGKTQLANEYAHRNAADYDIVWWIRSEVATTLESDYASLAVKLNLPEKDATEQRVTVEAVKEWLRRHIGWLLIFDNVEAAESIRNYIPPGNAGHTIITSRSQSWRGVATSLSVETLPLDEAIAFLLKRTGEQDEVTAKQLAEALGRLPLALEQASAYMEKSGSTIKRYLKLFTERQKEMMQRDKPSADYNDTVATTWSLSFQNVERDNPAAADLLRLCAFFAPEDIPLKMLIDGAKEMPEPLVVTLTNDLLLDDALTALRQYSLVDVKNEKLSVHRLVQAVIRYMLDDAAFKQWAGIAVHIVNTSFPEHSDDIRTWPICTPLLPHASTTLWYAEAIQFSSNETARLFNEVGVYLEARAEYEKAKGMYEHAIAIDEATLGVNHPTVAVRLNNLAGILRQQKDLSGAKTLYERALAIDEEAFGPNDPEVAIDLNNLGIVLKQEGDLTGAKALYERALAINEGAFGPNHPNVAIHLNLLGDLLSTQGHLTEAKALFERALAISEAEFGPNHPTVAIRLNNLGNVLRKQGDLIGAKAFLERSLQILRKSLGDEHPDTRTVQDHLRLVEEKLKDVKP